MKKEQKEKLHEDDWFVKTVRSFLTKVRTRPTVLNSVLLVLGVGLICLAVVRGCEERITSKAMDVTDTAKDIDEMERAAERYPGNADLLLKLGDAYLRRDEERDIEKAINMLETAVRRAQNGLQEGMACLALGKVLMNKEEYGQASEVFAKASTISETSPLIRDEANWYSGRCLEHLNRIDEALERYGRVVLEGSRGRGGMWASLARYRQIRLRQQSLD